MFYCRTHQQEMLMCGNKNWLHRKEIEVYVSMFENEFNRMKVNIFDFEYDHSVKFQHVCVLDR